MVAEMIIGIEVLTFRCQYPESEPVYCRAEVHVGRIDKPVLVFFIEPCGKSWNRRRLGEPGRYVRIQVGIFVEQSSELVEIMRAVGEVTGDEKSFWMAPFPPLPKFSPFL